LQSDHLNNDAIQIWNSRPTPCFLLALHRKLTDNSVPVYARIVVDVYVPFHDCVPKVFVS